MWVCLHWYLWAIQTKVWRQCSIWTEEKSQGKTLYIFFHRLCVHLKDTQIEVTTCAKVSRIEKYMDKLTLKITLRAMPKWYFTVQFSSVQLLSRVQLFATPLTAARQAYLSITNSQSLLKLMPIKSVMPSSHLILCCPLLFLPPIPPIIRVFSNESTLPMRWPKYWSFNFSISPSNEHPGLISFRMGWLDLLAVQGTLQSILQHHSAKASIFRHSAFFTVHLSHPYMTTGKTIALTRQTFVGK